LCFSCVLNPHKNNADIYKASVETMIDLPVKLPLTAIREVVATLIPDVYDAPSGSVVQLRIRISDKDLVVRDMAAFLELVDHVYGRCTFYDFRSYALRESGHLEFATTQKDSVELTVKEVFGAATELTPIIVLWLIFKYILPAIQSLATSYNQFQQGLLARENRRRIREEGLLARENRRRIREEMGASKELGSISKKRRAELARLIVDMLERDYLLMPRVRRFIRKSFLGVRLEIVKREETNKR